MHYVTAEYRNTKSGRIFSEAIRIFSVVVLNYPKGLQGLSVLVFWSISACALARELVRGPI